MLKTHNAIPYLLLIIMGLILYMVWDKYSIAKEQIEEQAQMINSAYDAMGTIVEYNDKRFDELKQLDKREWKLGKHKISI